MISEERKKEYLNLAKDIKEGKHDARFILAVFESEQNEAAEIVTFWMQHNEMTQSVVHYLAIEKLKIKFENCYKKELPKWHLKTISYGLTRITSILKKII